MGYSGYLDGEVKDSQVYSTEFYVCEYSVSKTVFHRLDGTILLLKTQ